MLLGLYSHLSTDKFAASWELSVTFVNQSQEVVTFKFESPGATISSSSSSTSSGSAANPRSPLVDWGRTQALVAEAPGPLDALADVWADSFWEAGDYSVRTNRSKRLAPVWRSADWHSSTGELLPNGDRYPISRESFKRSFYPPSNEMLCKWTRLVDALNSGRNASICAIGGSMTMGYMLPPGGKNVVLGARWSDFVGDWITRNFPQWRLELHNIAISGQTAQGLVNNGLRLAIYIYAMHILLTRESMPKLSIHSQM